MSKKISIIVPVHNESKIINALLSHLVTITSQIDSEIIISDGQKNSTTLRAIDEKYLWPENIKTIKAPINRGNQMNKAADIATGETFVFLHADTFISGAALKQVPDLLKRTHASAGAFRFGIDSKKTRYRIIEKFINLRTMLTKIPYGDQAFFINRDYFFKLNGFFEFPIMEDIDFMKRVKKDGGKIVIADFKVLTSGRRWEKEGVFRCTLRNWFILTLYYSGIHPDRLIKYYKF